MAHTAGPWVEDDFIAGRIIGPDNVSICDVHGSAARAEEDDANQMLICAAPDLLAALEKAQRFIASTAVMLEGRGPVPEIVLLDIQNAITKAKGDA